MNDVFAVSAAPHIKQKISVNSVMWQVVLALTPALLVGIFFFGIQSLFLTIYAVAAAVFTEAIIQKFRKVPITVYDGSAIAVGKQIFGGLGFNIFNPALLGRAFMMASWPTLMTAGWKFTTPMNNLFQNSINGLRNLPSNVPDVVTSATPLGVVKALRDTTQISSDMANTPHILPGSI